MDRVAPFAGDDPVRIAQDWLVEAEKSELNDANAAALATVDESGMPNARVVLVKEINALGFVFFTNYTSAKGQELAASGKAALNFHWKGLRRQVRVRGLVSRASGHQSDVYYQSRGLESRLGAWVSAQSQPLASRAQLEAAMAEAREVHGESPQRPPFWGGYVISPLEIELWCDGKHRLHDRFVWKRADANTNWTVERLNP